MTVAITGAAGQLGRLTAQRVLELAPATELVLVTRRPEAVADLAGAGAVVRHGDFDEPASLAGVFDGCERVLLISTDVLGNRVAQHTAAIDAAAAAAVLTTDGHEDRVYAITGPELVSQADLAALVAEITGRPVEAVAIDDEAAAQALVDVGLPPEMARAYASFGTAIREGVLTTVSTAVHDLTGREPRSLREVLEAHRSEIEESA